MPTLHETPTLTSIRLPQTWHHFLWINSAAIEYKYRAISLSKIWLFGGNRIRISPARLMFWWAVYWFLSIHSTFPSFKLTHILSTFDSNSIRSRILRQIFLKKWTLEDVGVRWQKNAWKANIIVLDTTELDSALIWRRSLDTLRTMERPSSDHFPRRLAVNRLKLNTLTNQQSTMIN